MSEPYSELGGLHRGDQWSECNAIGRDCTDCGARAGVKCTFEAQFHQPGLGLVTKRVTRHMPCLSRQSSAAVAAEGEAP